MNKHGVDDLVLLEQINEESVVATVKSRYDADLIYTYIGQVLIAVNPYKPIKDLYGPLVVKNYAGRYFFEEPPHIYALAEDAYKSLLMEGVNQCIIITGESGSGKTESSKFIMQYIAAVTGKGKQVQRVKDQILESNPVLEAFGNAKTVQNNNSSRFGKYFEIQFNYSGDPTGGRITNYLLEKSRVISQAQDERNFHIFYQLLAGDLAEKEALGLTKPEDFQYLNQSNCFSVQGLRDADEFKKTKQALTVVGISEDNQTSIYKLLAFILHLGNAKFKAIAKDKSEVVDRGSLDFTAQLLGVSGKQLEDALTTRLIQRNGPRGSSYTISLSPDQSSYTRDALAKSVYNRLFDWLVQAINTNICDDKSEFNIGVLDIYGFEIFRYNSFEQLCINYVNEKLQQIFIELTLKSEQEEYVKEKINWTNIDYVNNKPCVELIEKRNGIMGILDEECVFPKGTDETFLEKLNKACSGNPLYEKSADMKKKDIFTIKHYAGNVTYTIGSFLDKNKDELYNNLRAMLQSSSSSFIKDLFPTETITSTKRPPTSIAQFKTQVGALVDTLMSCTPHYIRCIRPNGMKASGQWDATLCTNQVRYLGLLENVRVRRAGFAYRLDYKRFVRRFKILSAKTYPKSKLDGKEGAVAILEDCNIPAQSFELGVSKVFIKNPQTLFALEELRSRKLDDIVQILQKFWRIARGRQFYRKCIATSIALFGGHKERRRDSVFRPFMGDYANFKGSQANIGIEKKFQDKAVLFADKINKINQKLEVQIRDFVITDNSIYTMSRTFLSKTKIHRRIMIKNVTEIVLSTLCDNYFVLLIPSEKYDLVAENPKKTEIVTCLTEAYRTLCGKDLPVRFEDNFSFKTRAGKSKKLSFIKDETCTEPRGKKNNSDTYQVSVASGLAKDAGRKKREVPKSTPKAQHINTSGKGSKAAKAKFESKAVMDYVARSARELSFRTGDIINVITNDSTGMWQGELKGKRGIFPSNYVKQV